MDICIITPDIVGPVKNGGIGTHCYHLAKFARSRGDGVTVLFTGAMPKDPDQKIARQFRDELGVCFLTLADIQSRDIVTPVHSGTWFAMRSLNIARWLAREEAHFDLVLFQDWMGNGYIATQMKRCGLAFRNLPLVTMLHSPEQWQREGMQTLPKGGFESLMLDYYERTAAEYSDWVIAPTQHMFDWAVSHGWKLPERREVIPYLLVGLPPQPEPAPFAGQDVIFFGRLETRKGLGIFTRALLALEPDLQQSGRTLRLHFLGKDSWIEDEPAIQWLRKQLGGGARPWSLEIVDNLGHQSALQYLIEHKNALVVTPSLLDNMPFAILEAATLNLNVLPTRVGGVPEIFEPGEALPEPTVRGLLTALRPALTEGRFTPFRRDYSPEKAEAHWAEFLANFGHRLPEEKAAVGVYELYPGKPETAPIPAKGFEFLGTSTPTSLRLPCEEAPVVTVCIPYYNSGAYLPDTLRSLHAQTFDAFEVVIVDDGSTDLHSKKVFDEMQSKYEPCGWRFLHKQNEGIGVTRNFAAAQARGRYFVFMDSDNIANPRMLQSMVASIEYAGVDCLTCYCTAFRDGDPGCKPIYSYTPMGDDLASGLLGNHFGDANFIIRREVFQSLGGFGPDRNTSYEDYEFLFRLVQQGWGMAVLPQFLFFYRHLEDGFSRVTSRYANQLRAISGALECLPEWRRRFIIASLGAFEEAEGLRGQLHVLLKKNGPKKKAPKKDPVFKRLERKWRRRFIYPVREFLGWPE